MSSPHDHSPSEGCGIVSGEVTEVRLNAAALTDPNSFYTKVSFPQFPTLSASGLVDSGSSHCFIDPSFISKNKIPYYDIPPVTLRLLDGSVGASIARIADIDICFSTNDKMLLRFYVTKLDSATAMVFGHNWLHRYNPSIDWSAGHIEHFRNLAPSVLSSAPAGPSGAPAPPAASLPPLPSSTPPPSVSPDTSDFDFDSLPVDVDSASPSSSQPPFVSFINAAAYARLARLPGNTLFTVTVSDSVTGRAATAEPADTPKIPEDYQEFQDVFSKKSAGTLPPHR